VTGEGGRLLLRHGGRILDAGAPHRELADDDPSLRRLPPGSVLVMPSPPGAAWLARSGDGWLVAEELFWSLVDPLAPGAAADDPDTTDLLRRLWGRLAWWRAVEESERGACAALLDRYVRGGRDLVTIIDRVARAGSPFGAAAGPPAAEPPAAAPSLPRDPAALAAYLTDPAGLGACFGEGFVPRREQADMAAAVARALDHGQALLAEAGTGTGKTLAYLAPLVANLADPERRAVIATYSRALQAQILDGDLPRLLGGGHARLARLLMGRGNYLCLRQRRTWLARPLEDGMDALRTAALRMWLAATAEGRRDELAGHPLLGSETPTLFSGVQPCLPECWEQPGCFVVRARRLARDARLVVVNHALLLSDHAAGGALIGPFSDLVVDEAHRLPGATLDACTIRLDQRRLADLEELVGSMRPAGQLPETAALAGVRLRQEPAGERAAEAAEAFGRAVGRCQRAYAVWWRSAGDHLAPGEGHAPGQRQRIVHKDVVFGVIAERTGELLEAAAETSAAAAILNQRAEAHEDLPPGTMDLLVRCAQAGQLAQSIERDVRFVTGDPGDRWVTWLEPGRRGELRALGATPLESGPLLRDVWQDRQLAPVATSATLAVGEDFGFMMGELGLTGRRPQTAAVTVPSPFRWETQSLALAAEDMPDPDSADFPEAVAEVLADLRRDVGRQTLGLFTSYRLLQDVAGRLREAEGEADLFDADPPGDLLVQSPGASPVDLRDRFRASRGATLLGASTFWEGVDFPGESLEVVVVTKLPFLVPNDPWVQARCDHLRQAGQDPFRDFMVRDAVLRLRQGVGRLLRRRQDRGVILLLDNRLIKRGYGATFLASLPAPVRWLPRRADLAGAVADFLSRA
jgi:ATP-dependent DNA helicase DinG